MRTARTRLFDALAEHAARRRRVQCTFKLHKVALEPCLMPLELLCARLERFKAVCKLGVFRVYCGDGAAEALELARAFFERQGAQPSHFADFSADLLIGCVDEVIELSSG